MRDNNQIGHPSTLITFEETVVLFLNHKPKFGLKFGDMRRAFDTIARNDRLSDEHGGGSERGQLSRMYFIDTLKNMGQTVASLTFRSIIILFVTVI